MAKAFVIEENILYPSLILMCNENKWFSKGNSKDYEKLRKIADEKSNKVTFEKIYKLACVIYNYTDISKFYRKEEIIEIIMRQIGENITRYIVVDNEQLDEPPVKKISESTLKKTKNRVHDMLIVYKDMKGKLRDDLWRYEGYILVEAHDLHFTLKGYIEALSRLGLLEYYDYMMMIKEILNEEIYEGFIKKHNDDIFKEGLGYNLIEIVCTHCTKNVENAENIELRKLMKKKGITDFFIKKVEDMVSLYNNIHNYRIELTHYDLFERDKKSHQLQLMIEGYVGAISDLQLFDLDELMDTINMIGYRKKSVIFEESIENYKSTVCSKLALYYASGRI